MTNRLSLIVVLLALSSVSAIAEEPEEGTPCAASKLIVSKCFVVHGRMFAANGSPDIRIWRIGSKRVLGVLDGAGHSETASVIPDSITKWYGGPHGAEPNPADAIYGDFYVCPLTHRRPGWMQMVCLRKATNFFVEHPKSN